MKRKKHRRGGLNGPSPVVQSTIGLTTGVVGLGVASTIGAGIPGLTGTIVNQGVMPIAGVSLMGEAANFGKRRRR